MLQLVRTQNALRFVIEGREPTSDKNDVRTIAFALITEIHEVANELGWKGWRNDPAPDRDRILDEWADVLSYVGTLTGIVMLRTGCSVADLEDAYFEKHGKNWDRYREGGPDSKIRIPQSDTQTEIEGVSDQ